MELPLAPLGILSTNCRCLSPQSCTVKPQLTASRFSIVFARAFSPMWLWLTFQNQLLCTVLPTNVFLPQCCYLYESAMLLFIWVCFTGITKQLPSFYFVWETLLESMSINLAFSQIAPHGYLSLIKMCSLALTLKLLYFRWFFAQIQFSWLSFRLYRNCGFRWLKRGLLDRILCLNTFLC